MIEAGLKPLAQNTQALQKNFDAMTAQLRQYEPSVVTTLDIGTHTSIWDAYAWLKSRGGRPTKPAPAPTADNASPSHQAQHMSTMMPTGDEAVAAGRISLRRTFRSAALAIPPVRRLYNRAANAAQRIEALEADNRELRRQIAAASSVVPQATALTISIHRNGHVIRISPAQFDAFEFRSGDTLDVEPAFEAAKLLRTPDGHYHIQLGPDVGLRIPPKINLVSFRGFRCQSICWRSPARGSTVSMRSAGRTSRTIRSSWASIPP